MTDQFKISGHLMEAFEEEKIICRLLAAWVQFVALLILSGRGGRDFSELSFAQDISLFMMVVLIFMFFTLFSAVAVVFNKCQTDTWFLMISSTICVAYWIWNYNSKEDKMLFLMAVIVVYCLFLTYFIQRNETVLKIVRPDHKTTVIFTIACGLVSGIVISVVTCLRYKTFSAPNFDFGLFCNMFHYMKETGMPLVTSERDRLLSHFAVHLSPVYYLLLPFYFVFPSPLTLQIGQAVLVASGVVPVFLLARSYKLQEKTAMLLCFLYSFYPALSCGCFYDLHENCFLAPTLLWMFYFFEKKNYVLMYLSAFVVLMVKEDAMLYVAVFGIYMCLSRKEYKHGIIFIIGALTYFSIASYILRTFGTGLMDVRFDNLIYDKKDSLFGVVKTALLNPGYLLTQLFSTGDAVLDGFFYEKSSWAKFSYFLQLFLPLGMMPFFTRKPSRWLLLVPVLMNLLTGYKYQYSLSFQYNFAITAFFIYAVIQNASECRGIVRQYILAFGAVACCCFYIAMVLTELNGYVSKWQDGKDTYHQMEEILSTIPKDASLNVSSVLLAHVADRRIVYEVAVHGNRPDVDYVVLDARFDVGKVKEAYLQQGYGVYKDYEGLILILNREENM